MHTQQPSAADSSLVELRRAVESNDPAAIRAALPDPPHFLTSVIQQLPCSERDAVLAGVLLALEAEEDVWYIIEAAAMNDTVRPQNRVLVAVAPFILADQLADALTLAQAIPDTEASAEAQQAIRMRAAKLALPIDR